MSYQHAATPEVRSLWVGDLQYWADENYLYNCFAHTGEVTSIKIIRNKISGLHEGYGFVEFASHAAAERILQTYNGTQMPGTVQSFRLNWASFGMGERHNDGGPDHSIFVGDLAPDVTDYLLQETFQARYPSVRGAKVVTEANTGRSKGYGFVKFGDEMERNRAMTEMNGVYCSTRPMRISAAAPKKSTGVQQQYPTAKAISPTPMYSTPPSEPVPPDHDVTNTTVFVGGLDPNVIEEELKQAFAQFGEIISVKIPQGKGCGFVQFSTRTSAEEAIQRMHGAMIGQQNVRLSWGRNLPIKQDPAAIWGQQGDPSQWASAYYGYSYDAYAYGAAQDPSLYAYGAAQDPSLYAYGAAQDPSLYAYGAYPGYGSYHHQVEGVQDITYMAGGAVPGVEHRGEVNDPLAIPDVDKLNATYLSVHGNAMLGKPLWLKTSGLSQPP